MITLSWLILWIPFAAAIFLTFAGQSKPRFAALTATGSIFACFILSLFILFQLSQSEHSTAAEHSITWMKAGGLTLEYGILINPMTVLMLLIVTGIGSLIFLYSMTYMKDDPSAARYFTCLSLFAFSMLGIVVANNLIQIFIHWELVGLSSYLLIGFWYQKDSASTAGKKAFLTTRVGDVGMMIGILILFGFFAKAGLPSFNFLEIKSNISAVPVSAGWMTALCLCIFMGVVGKSAQMPLHVWLPDAMEGPTPVSALIHAATMVAAGVFLLARLDFLYALSSDAAQVIAWTGAITALVSATIALVQNDIKKILAYSTLSQLGYMVMAMGLHHPEAGMFHLTTHAFFKALLFLGAGSFIHAFHTQNIWEMKTPALMKKMPVTTITFLAATLALMGIPPLSGFYSKEEILTAAHGGPAFLFYIALAVVFLTSFYMGRLTTALLWSPEKESHAHPHEADWKMTSPLVILGVFSVIGGFLPIKAMISGHASSHHAENWLLWTSLGLALGGFICAIIIFRKNKNGLSFLSPFRAFGTLLEKKYFFDDVYDFLISKVQGNIARISDAFERIVVVESGVNGLAKLTRVIGDRLRRLQSGSIQHYALYFVAGFILLFYFFTQAGAAS